MLLKFNLHNDSLIEYKYEPLSIPITYCDLLSSRTRLDNNLHASPTVKLGYCAPGPVSLQPADNAETTLIHDHEYSEAVSPSLIIFNTTHEPSKTQCDC